MCCEPSSLSAIKDVYGNQHQIYDDDDDDDNDDDDDSGDDDDDDVL
jgi:hypothetical protein